MEPTVCIDCQRPFVLTDKEKQFFVAMKLTLPKRCKNCRRVGILEKKISALRKLIAKLAAFTGFKKDEQKLPEKQDQGIQSPPPAST